MGAIDDTRKVLQDFLAPEIREIKTRLDALEKRMEERFDHAERMEKERFVQVGDRFSQVGERFSQVGERFRQVDDHFRQVDERFLQAERNAEIRHVAVISEIRGLQNYDDIRERLAKLEASKETVHQ